GRTRRLIQVPTHKPYCTGTVRISIDKSPQLRLRDSNSIQCMSSWGPLPHQSPSASAVLGARQRSRDASEEPNYLYTQQFLERYAGYGYEIAELGAKCLKLNQTLGLCDPRMPWKINTSYMKFESIAILPVDAALKAHFCLEAWISPTPRKLRYGNQMFIDVKFDENVVLSRNSFWFFFTVSTSHRVLRSVVNFLESLRGIALNGNLNEQAEKLANALENTIVVKLTDFQINEKAVEMFCHALRGHVIPR
ncbi:hypothetical protein GYMLUDRAFT_998810, partial [Collybiopsis luxurians FD-317 M1]